MNVTASLTVKPQAVLDRPVSGKRIDIGADDETPGLVVVHIATTEQELTVVLPCEETSALLTLLTQANAAARDALHKAKDEQRWPRR